MRQFLLAVILLCLGSGSAMAGAIEIVHPWARPTIPNRPGVAYFGIHNNGETDDKLIGAHANGVETVELHLAGQKDGVMTMAPVDAVDVPAGGMAHLGPGGYHLMLFGLAKPLQEGDELTLTLIFKYAGEVGIMVPVSRESPNPSHDDGGTGHGHGHSHTHGQGTGN